MTNKFSMRSKSIVSKTIGKFHGGIHPEQYKSLSSNRAIEYIRVPKELVLPLQQSIGEPSLPTVKVGDYVVQGQLIAESRSAISANIHSPVDGKIAAITLRQTGHSSGLLKQVIVIQTLADFEFTEQEHLSCGPVWLGQSKHDLLEKIRQAGIVGLGGATFPTDRKLTTPPIKTLIVNAMECEPYITCDDRLLQERAPYIIIGAQISAYIVGAKNIIFAIEDNKPDALKAVEHAIKQSQLPIKMKVVVAPTKYPSGGEKQTIELLFNKQLPKGKLPASIGVILQNTATLYSIYNAIIRKISLTKRLITITGDAVKAPGNYWIPLGTTLEYLFELFNISKQDCPKVIFGGPLMGHSVSELKTPVTKSTNCIIFNRNKTQQKTWVIDASEHQQCIRCGDCEKVCPVELLPQQLYWFSQSEQWEPLEKQGLFDCIECGACAYVCPSKIPLIHYFRFGKSAIKDNRIKQKKSENAKKRFEFREMRLQRVKDERALKHQKAAQERSIAAQNKDQDPSGKQTAINQALERVKQKKALLKDTNKGDI